MKKVIIISLLALGINAKAQEKGFHYGTRVGIGQSTFKDVNSDKIKEQPGKLTLNGGIATMYQFNDKLGLTLDGLISSKGTKLRGEETVQSSPFSGNTYTFEDNYKLFYVELPLCAKLSFGSDNFRVKFYGGVSQNYKLAAFITRRYDNENYGQNNNLEMAEYKNVRVGETAAVYGIGVEVKSSTGEIFSIDGRQSSALQSFGKIYADQSKNAFNRYFAISLAYYY